jgi:hypothetical protein
MDEDVKLVQDLVAEFPEFEEDYELHSFGGGDILPHVFFWDVVQGVTSSFLSRGDCSLDWRAVISYLEDQLKRDVPEVTEVIVTSFIGNLPYPGSPGSDLANHLGPCMAEFFRKVRPAG